MRFSFSGYFYVTAGSEGHSYGVAVILLGIFFFKLYSVVTFMCNTFTLQVFLLYIPQKHLMSTLFHVIVYDNQTKYKTAF